MHVEHKAGDKMYIDFVGKKLEMVDQQSGEIREMKVFVAILGASQLTYAEAKDCQGKEDLIRACENVLHYFGGDPKDIIPDNLKASVTKSNRYEPILKKTVADFAEHYSELEPTVLVNGQTYSSWRSGFDFQVSASFNVVIEVSGVSI